MLLAHTFFTRYFSGRGLSSLKCTECWLHASFSLWHFSLSFSQEAMVITLFSIREEILLHGIANTFAYTLFFDKPALAYLLLPFHYHFNSIAGKAISADFFCHFSRHWYCYRHFIDMVIIDSSLFSFLMPLSFRPFLYFNMHYEVFSSSTLRLRPCFTAYEQWFLPFIINYRSVRLHSLLYIFSFRQLILSHTSLHFYKIPPSLTKSKGWDILRCLHWWDYSPIHYRRTTIYHKIFPSYAYIILAVGLPHVCIYYYNILI